MTYQRELLEPKGLLRKLWNIYPCVTLISNGGIEHGKGKNVKQPKIKDVLNPLRLFCSSSLYNLFQWLFESNTKDRPLESNKYHLSYD